MQTIHCISGKGRGRAYCRPRSFANAGWDLSGLLKLTKSFLFDARRSYNELNESDNALCNFRGAASLRDLLDFTPLGGEVKCRARFPSRFEGAE